MTLWVLIAIALLITVGVPVGKIKTGAKWVWTQLKRVQGLWGSESDHPKSGVPIRVVISLCIISGVIGRQTTDFDLPKITIPGLSQLIETVTPTGPLTILVVEEATGGKLTDAQKQMLDGQPFKQYRDSHCAKIDGQPAYRRVDCHADLTWDHQIFQDVFKQPRSSDYWLYVSNGKAGASMPLPANETELMAVLKKYGGE